MIDEQLALARRIVACERFRWLPGMLAIGVPWVGRARLLHTEMREQDTFNGNPVDDVDFWIFDGGSCPAEDARTWLPDLSDPATLGCIEHGLLPEAWGEAWIVPDAWQSGDGGEAWACLARRRRGKSANRFGPFKTKAEALVAALEAAP